MKAKASIGVAALVALVALTPGISSGKMQSVVLAKGVCQTTGGGDFVDIPGFPGEKIDRRLLNDISMLRRKYKIFVTDGFSRDGVHSINGEHPLGLALDIVPNYAAGGDWNDIDRLAKWAEPQQNQPRAPFRWVGYNGDSGHGRGHHLHLSFSHGVSKPFKPVKTMYSVKCPGADDDGAGPRDDGGKGGNGGGGNGGGGGADNGGGGGNGGNGGADNGGTGGNGGNGGNNGGGVGTGGGNDGPGGGVTPRAAGLAPVAPETGGVDG